MNTLITVTLIGAVVRHSYSVVALVPSPSKQMRNLHTLDRQRFAASVPESDKLMVYLPRDYARTAKLSPGSWQDTGRRTSGKVGPGSFQFTGDGEPPLFAYVTPRYLKGEEYSLYLHAEEFGLPNDFAYAVAAHDASKLRPYYISSLPQDGDWHSRAKFSRSALSRVGWFKAGSNYRLHIDRAQLEVEKGEVIVRSEKLFESEVTAQTAMPKLPNSLRPWHPVIKGLHARLLCKKRGCGSHYAR